MAWVYGDFLKASIPALRSSCGEVSASVPSIAMQVCWPTVETGSRAAGHVDSATLFALVVMYKAGTIFPVAREI